MSDSETPFADEIEESAPEPKFIEDGLLWAINRYILHPEGLALAQHYETGKFSILRAKDGIFSFEPDHDKHGREKFQRFLRWHGAKR